MLKLYGQYRSRAFRVAWLCKESNIPYEHVNVTVNVDGAIAAISADLGFAYELGNAMFLVSRLPGLIAHAHEERTRQTPMRQIDPKDHDYDGSGERRLPGTRK